MRRLPIPIMREKSMKRQFSLLLIAFIWSSFVSANNECATLPAIWKNQIFVGWTTNERTTTQFSAGEVGSKTTSLGAFRIVAVIENNKITETIGASMKNGQRFWSVNNPKNSVVLTSVDSFLDHMNNDHCVYSASINSSKYPLWSLFTSSPDNRFKMPSKTEADLFHKLNTLCVNQGDYPEGEEPPCTKPTLLAITDINKNNKPEFWATEPYMWDDGLSVWEYDGKELGKIFEVCVGCSD